MVRLFHFGCAVPEANDKRLFYANVLAMKKDKKLKIKFYRAFRIELRNPGKSLIILSSICFLFVLLLAALLLLSGCPSSLIPFNKPAEISIKFNDA